MADNQNNQEPENLTRRQYRKIRGNKRPQPKDDDLNPGDFEPAERVSRVSPGETQPTNNEDYKTPRWLRINRRLNISIGVLIVLIIIVYLILFFVN